LPLDKYVSAERAWDMRHIHQLCLCMISSLEFLYELRMNDTNYPVSGPLSGDIGLFVRDVMETPVQCVGSQSRE